MAHHATRRSPLSPSPGRRVRRVLTTVVAAVAVCVPVAAAHAATAVPTGPTPVTAAAVAPPTAATASVERLWGTERPAGSSAATHDRSKVELGTRFTVRQAGTATGVRFWKAASDTGVHTGSLWSATGTRLATVRFADETAGGWQTATFSSPVALTAGRSYVVSYTSPRGGYTYTPSFDGRGWDTASLDVADRGVGVFTYGSGMPRETYRDTNYWVGLTFTPATQTAPAPTPAPTPEPTPQPAPRFPDATTTGVPSGTTLTPYDGPCTITTPGTVIDAKNVSCSLTIRAKDVRITRSKITGTVYNDTSGRGSFRISDSEVAVGNRMGTGLGDADFTAVRVHVHGGNRSINCFRTCTVEDSYVHGQFRDDTGRAHESGIRMGSGSTIRGNTIACDAPDVPPDAGCSAALTGYGDFAVVQDNVIDGNLFVAGSGGYCTYGGSTKGKPYSAGVNDIRFTNNVWQKGASGRCGSYGPITAFDSAAPGNVWSNNTWDDGTPVRPAN